MKDLIKKILKKRFDIDIIFTTLDIDCTRIYVYYENMEFVENICELLYALRIVVYNKDYSDDCCVISCEIIDKSKSEYILND